VNLDFEIAGMHLRIASESRRLLDRIADRFQSYETDAGSEVHALIEFVDRGDGWKCERPRTAPYPEADMRHEAGRYEFWRDDFEGTVVVSGSSLTGKFDIRADKNCFETPVRLVTALCGARRGTLLLHAAGALFGGKALVFTAVSGGGKTTLLSLLKVPDALSDEIVALGMVAGAPVAFATPFTGGPSPAGRKSGPLAAICFIHKADENRVAPAERRSAFRRIMRNTLAYVADAETAGGIMAAAHDISASTGLHELDFQKSPAIHDFLVDFAASRA